MSMTLTQLRTRVAKYLDDVDNADATTSDIDTAASAEFPTVYKLATRISPKRFAKEASVSTTAAGLYDLTTLAPWRILAVNYVNGVERWPVPEVDLSDGPADAAGVKSLKLLYVPKLTFPAAVGDPFVWGQSSIDMPELDDLLCLRTASRLGIFLDQPNEHLEKLVARAESDMERTQLGVGAGFRMMPLRGRSRDSGIAYVKTDDVTLQIVSARIVVA